VQVRGRPVHFGLQLQAQRVSWLDYADGVRAVEEIGFGSVWTFDHLLPFAGPDDGDCFETLTTMGALALVTQRARFGVLVNGNLYRHPAVLAKASAQVDQMSRGRLEFTLGAAWAEREFEAYGLGFPSLSERYARLDEALQVVKLLWGQHRTDFEGRFYRLAAAPCEPKPLQSPRPPITVGGTGRGSLKLAAKHADRLNMMGSPDECAGHIARLEQFCREIGRNMEEIELSLHPSFGLAPDHDGAVAHATRTAARLDTDLAAQSGRWLIGTPSELAAAIRPYLELGISHFVFASGFPLEPEPLRLLQNEVLPALVAP
jgi:alkanesulfonate monooxygenase SsuD/methylene tetrahydromethanopterin reductase-like flavin-dependent oxidoreductase (luciferase family)